MRRVALLLILALATLAVPAVAQDSTAVEAYIEDAHRVREIQVNRVKSAHELAGAHVAASNYNGISGMMPGGREETADKKPSPVEQATGGAADGSDDSPRTPPAWVFAFLGGTCVLFLWQRRRHNADQRPR